MSKIPSVFHQERDKFVYFPSNVALSYSPSDETKGTYVNQTCPSILIEGNIKLPHFKCSFFKQW